MVQTRATITGLDSVVAAIFDAADPRTHRTIAIGGLRAAANVARKAARQRNFGFTDRSGRLRRAIRVRVARRRSGKGPRVYLQAGVERGQGAAQGFIVEAGRGPGGWHRGPAPPHPYLAPAVMATTGQQEIASVQAMQQVADRVFRRYVTKQSRRTISLGASFGRTAARRARRR